MKLPIITECDRLTKQIPCDGYPAHLLPMILAFLTRGLKACTYRGAGYEMDNESTFGLDNSFELMKELFGDFNTNGTQVISAAAGDSYALESSEWQNGVFTFSLLDGFINKKADLDENGSILVSELKE